MSWVVSPVLSVVVSHGPPPDCLIAALPYSLVLALPLALTGLLQTVRGLLGGLLGFIGGLLGGNLLSTLPLSLNTIRAA